MQGSIPTRTKLAKYDGKKVRFTATIERFSRIMLSASKRTALLTDVAFINGDPVTDHLWAVCGKWSRHLSKGDTIEFLARVVLYQKEYLEQHQWVKKQEYGVQHINDVKVIEPPTALGKRLPARS